jgi:hypothetical protein
LLDIQRCKGCKEYISLRPSIPEAASIISSTPGLLRKIIDRHNKIVSSKTDIDVDIMINNDMNIINVQREINSQNIEKPSGVEIFYFRCKFCGKDIKTSVHEVGNYKKCPKCKKSLLVANKDISIKDKIIYVIVTALIVWGSIACIIALLFFACSPEKNSEPTEPVTYSYSGSSSNTSYSSNTRTSKVTKSQVIAETRKALDMAASRVGSSYSGFTVDHCIIGTDKATCHFSLTEKGIRKTGAIEFNISGSSLIPSGQFYLE